MEFSVTLDGEPEVDGTLPATDVARVLSSLADAVEKVMVAAPSLGLSSVEAHRLTLTADAATSAAVDALVHAVAQGADPRAARALLGLADSIGVGERYRAVVLSGSGTAGEDETRLDAEVVRRLRSSTQRDSGVPRALADADAAFNARPTLADLAERQGVTGPVNVARLYDAAATDEERDVFMAAIAELG
ncbi:MAG TPA: hypothetical protein VN238_01415 [Solirubrobacteraceae bacterium]|nr:hypothetical protein [Solirubrobacteraceae bacterium]